MISKLILCAVLSTILVDHELHLSKCEINYKEELKELQIELHFFMDDLEEAIITAGGDSLYLFMNDEHPNADQLIQDYVTDHFSIALSGYPLEMNWVGKEI
ncbi:MAG: DUF6702 family protein, partial [Bacteroidota bacterium]